MHLAGTEVKDERKMATITTTTKAGTSTTTKRRKGGKPPPKPPPKPPSPSPSPPPSPQPSVQPLSLVPHNPSPVPTREPSPTLYENPHPESPTVRSLHSLFSENDVEIDETHSWQRRFRVGVTLAIQNVLGPDDFIEYRDVLDEYHSQLCEYRKKVK